MLTTNQKEYLKKCCERYKSDLLNNILPFWLSRCVDSEYNGYMTCIDKDGSFLDTAKVMWVQGRFAWVLSATYNHIDKNPDYLKAAKSGLDFIEEYGTDTDGRMFFLMTKEGKPLRKRRYVFSETFAAIAMAEYAIATGNKSYAQKALDLFKLILSYINTPGLLEPKNIPGNRDAIGHSICMILINTAHIIREAIDDPILTQQIEQSIAQIRDYFMHPEFKALLETVTPDGKFLDTIDGRVINPGHAIETAWFILEEAKYKNWDKKLVEMGLQILDWSWEWGWDKEYGGIIYFRDCKNKPAQEYWHDMKFWWPQNEAVIATLYAYLASGNEKYLKWHKQIHDYAFDLFPDPEYGEWYGYFHRDGRLSQPAKGNYYKGPFHVPRMMLKGHLLCKDILEKELKSVQTETV